MKKILITGANSYIGCSFEQWIKRWNNHYKVDTVDLRNNSWIERNYSEYDAVFHVAGIAHVDAKNSMKELYYQVNRDLAIETAKKMMTDGVRQFIFMSSIIVYGENTSYKRKTIITNETIPKPSNFYGDSKLQAENGILSISSDNFKVAIIRAPMIYGKGSKGNYPKLSKFAKKSFIFPYVKNERSMLHIDNLCEFVRQLIDNNESGIFYPQNEEYTCTSEMVKMIAEVNGNKLILTKILNPFLFILPHRLTNKIFGSVVYSKELSKYKFNYIVHDLYESIRITEEH